MEGTDLNGPRAVAIDGRLGEGVGGRRGWCWRSNSSHDGIPVPAGDMG